MVQGYSHFCLYYSYFNHPTTLGVLLLPGSGEFPSAGLCKDQGDFSGLEGEALDNCSLTP